MKHILVLVMTLLALLSGCDTSQAAMNVEATVQAAVQQTIAAVTPLPLLPTATPTLDENLRTLETKFSSLCWVAYTPTHYDPNAGIFPAEADIREDLQILHNAGFSGLVTYGSQSALRRIPQMALEAGFSGAVMGVWSPTDSEEIANAKNATAYVDGYVVGNEGLFFGRYDFNTLKAAMDDVRSTTQKPVATTEVLESYYSDSNIRGLGDWAFPNVHPYWNGIKMPHPAVTWTQQQFAALSTLFVGSSKKLVFKEVGLPTAGDPEVSEAGQADYYKLLKGTDVKFVYFESFDQPWKNSQPVEPHWGLYRNDRSPKLVVNYVCAKVSLYLPSVVQSSYIGK